MKTLERLHIPDFTTRHNGFSLERTPEFALATEQLLNNIRPALAEHEAANAYQSTVFFPAGDHLVHWQYDDEHSIAGSPDAIRGRWEETVHVRNDDNWHHTAELHYIKNLLRIHITNLEKDVGATSETTGIATVTLAEVKLEAISTNGRDMVRGNFTCDTTGWQFATIRNGAPYLFDFTGPNDPRIASIVEEYNYDPSPSDLSQLKTSAKLLADVIKQLKQPLDA